MDAKSWGFEHPDPSTGDKRALPVDTLETTSQDAKRFCTEPCDNLIDYNCQNASYFTSPPWTYQDENTAESYSSNTTLFEPTINDAALEQSHLLPSQNIHPHSSTASDVFYDVYNPQPSFVPDLYTYHNTRNSNYMHQEASNRQTQSGWWPEGDQNLQCAPNITYWSTPWDSFMGANIGTNLPPQITIEEPHIATNHDFGLQLPSLDVLKPEPSNSVWNSPLSSSMAPTSLENEDKSELEGTTAATSPSVFPDNLGACSDVCFGVASLLYYATAHANIRKIATTSVSSYSNSQNAKTALVNTKASGDILKLYFQDSNKYAGIITLPVLCKLLQDFTVQLKTTLMLSESRSKREFSKRKVKPAKEYSARIIVYGIEDEMSAVGSLLSDADLFLQHPSITECARHIRYCNPHYLLRPGSEMPKLEDLSLTTDARSPRQHEQLDEVNTARLLRIFDCADVDGSQVSVSVEPSPRLQSRLMAHQLTALAMMIERECGTVENSRFPTLWTPVLESDSCIKYRHIITGAVKPTQAPISGGILADSMGLGKTLSMLALICSSLDGFVRPDGQFEKAGPSGTLIVCPKSTIAAWQFQISKHVSPRQIESAIYHGSDRERLATRFYEYDIIVTTYETMRSEWETQGPLFNGKWLRIVLDEAHHIRNRKSKTFKAALEIKARYRWCLTGTPIHNSLDDYGALLTFIDVDSLSEKSLFDRWIVSPIKDQRPGSIQRLKHVVKATCLRRTKNSSTVALDLKSPVEKVEYIKLHRDDQELYDFVKKKTAGIAAEIQRQRESKAKGRSKRDGSILALMSFLRLICNHGKDILPKSALAVYTGSDSATSDWQTMRASQSTCDGCGEDLEETKICSLNSQSTETSRQSLCEACALEDLDATEIQDNCPQQDRTEGIGTKNRALKPATKVARPSAKMRSLIQRLRAEQVKREDQRPTKSVIFSQWTKMLDLVEPALRKHGFTFQRIDGQASLEARQEALRQFNEDPKCTVMLASIGSCGEGIDLTAANNVHLIEPHWNPMVEAQAVDRVHRKGQTRSVTITRYIVPESIETYIQWVQEDKLQLINQSLNDMDVSEPRNVDGERWKMLRACLET